jgi:hypothetical protein
MHAAHVLELVAFRTLEYLPASQSVHALEPMPSAYVPAGHGMHCSDNGTLCVISLARLKNPALHLQYFLSVSGFECTGHAVHGAEPVTSLYVPAAHSEQLPAGPVKPAGHTFRHCEIFVDPAAESVSSGHATQVLALPAPSVSEYVATRHSRHVASLLAPVVSEYDPAKHAEHAVLASEAKNPGVHEMHVLLSAAPTRALAVPAGHATQDASSRAPGAAPCLPAGHTAQNVVL